MPQHRKTKTRASRSKSTSPSRNRLNRLIKALGIFCTVTIALLWSGYGLWQSGIILDAKHAAIRKYYQTSTDMGFEVRTVKLEGRVYTDPDVLRAVLNVERGDPILAFNPKSAKDMIERIAWVEEAHVERQLPDGIRITLKEKQPLALWQDDKVIRLIDHRGELITGDNLARFKDLVLISGNGGKERAPALMTLLQAEPDILHMVDAAIWQGQRRWDLELENGMKVKLPEDSVPLALSRLAKAQREMDLLKKDIEVIDLRSPDRLIVKTRQGASRQIDFVSHKI